MGGPIRSILCLAAALIMIAGPAAGADPPRLNVLMIAVDDLRPELGCYGVAGVKSPNIDALAARGLVFGRAYCQQALCSPSRISLLSGRRPETTGIDTIGPTLRSKLPDVITLPQHFKDNGYFTRSIGKVFHVGIDDPPSWSVPSVQGRKPRHGPEGQALIRRRAADAKAAGREVPAKGEGSLSYASPAFEDPDCGDDDLLDGDAARIAVQALGEVASRPDVPFFLGVGFANPHVPWVAPRRYWDLYQEADLRLPDNAFPPRGAPKFAAVTGTDFTWYGNIPKDRVITPEFGRRCLHGYLAAISYVDAQVGRVLGELDRLGLRDKTVVLLWGDHGYYMGEHGWWGGKHNNYEGATRAPLIVSAPGIKAAGRTTAALTEFVDIYPSLADLCGLPAPFGAEGTSFRPLLDDPGRRWKDAAFSSYPKGGYRGTAMRTDRYRLVEWRKAGADPIRELYDHAADPQEDENLAARPEHEATVAALAGRLRAGWKAAVPR